MTLQIYSFISKERLNKVKIWGMLRSANYQMLIKLDWVKTIKKLGIFPNFNRKLTNINTLEVGVQ